MSRLSRNSIFQRSCKGALLSLAVFGLLFNTSRLARAQKTGGDTQTLEHRSRQIDGAPGVVTSSAVVNFAELARQEALVPAPAKDPKEIPPFMPGVLDLSGSGAASSAEQNISASSAPVASIPSPTAVASFKALEDNGTSIPPDTSGAVGPRHLLVALNTQVRIQNRAGGTISTVSLNSFWAGVGNNPKVFDPKVLYDPYGKRWIFTACADGVSITSSILIGVSQTDDPTGFWNLHRVDADTTNAAWADYPSIGFNKNWIVVSFNMFPINKNTSIRPYSQIYAFSKASLYAGGVRFKRFRDDSAMTPVPAQTFSNSLAPMYLVQTYTGNSGGKGSLRISTISGAVGAETLVVGTSFPTIANTWDEFPNEQGTDFAPQIGSTRKIQTNDSRLQSVVYRNGSLWCVHTVFLPAGGSPTRSAIQWWELNPSGGLNAAPRQFGRVDDPTAYVFYAFPSIAVNKHSNVLIGYSRFSSGTFASNVYSFRAATDPPNTLRSNKVLKGGEAPYYKPNPEAKNRWGDYSSTVVDPSSDVAMWTIQEYAATPSGSDRWSTWWGRINPPLLTYILKRSPVWTGAQSGLKDAANRPWYAVAFNDSPWTTAKLPERGSDSAADDRYYRSHFNWDGVSPATVSFSTDDGLTIYVNSRPLGSWGNGWRQAGCVNGSSECSINFSVPAQTIPASMLRPGDNVIAVDLWNAVAQSFYIDVDLTGVSPLSW